jgi:hypothetical protein
MAGLHLIPICFQQKANWYGGGEVNARKFLKNQASPVFQKLWRLAFKGIFPQVPTFRPVTFLRGGLWSLKREVAGHK